MRKFLSVFAVSGLLCLAGCAGGGLGGKADVLADAYDWVVAEYPSAASCFDLADDHSFVSVDTNPYDLDDYSVSGCFTAVEEFNDRLGLPDYVWEEMLHTSALDGRQSETANGITVSWKYHPDNGLEATYRKS